MEVMVVARDGSRWRKDTEPWRYPIDLRTLAADQRRILIRYGCWADGWTDGPAWYATVGQLLDFEHIWMLEGSGPGPRYPLELERELVGCSYARAEYLHSLRTMHKRRVVAEEDQQ